MKKILILAIAIFFTLTTIDNTFALKNIGDNVTLNSSMTYNEDVIIGGNFDTTGNLVINGDLEIGSNATIGGNLTVKGNLIVDSSIDIMGKLEVTGNASLGSNPTIDRGVVIGGNLETGGNPDISGFSKIMGDADLGSNATVTGTMYVYGNLDGGGNTDIETNKIKVVKNFDVGSNGDVVSRFYVYGTKDFGANSNESLKNFTGLMGEIDPLLTYNIAESTVNIIKNRIYSDLSKANSIQNEINVLNSKTNKDYDLIELKGKEKHNVYYSLFKYLHTYIQNENFDLNEFNKIKSRYLGGANVTTTNTNTSPTNTTNYNNSNNYSKYVPNSLKIRLNNALDSIEYSQREIIYNLLLVKIDQIIENKKNDKNLVNVLLGIKEMVQERLNKLN